MDSSSRSSGRRVGSMSQSVSCGLKEYFLFIIISSAAEVSDISMVKIPGPDKFFVAQGFGKLLSGNTLSFPVRRDWLKVLIVETTPFGPYTGVDNSDDGVGTPFGLVE